MNNFKRFLLGAVASSALGVTACFAQSSQNVDILITGGDVYSGANEPARKVDIGLSGDKIVFVGDARAEGVRAARRIDATGKMVVPGFIDAHVHADEEIASDDPKARLLLRQLTQGVTTSIIGVDGGGTPEVADFARSASAAGTGGNFASYVGFGAIRQRVLGEDDRAPTSDELKRMQAMAAKAMCEGALGLSSGLFYAPQSFASTEEIIAVTREAGKRGGLYDTHQRDEGNTSIGVVASTREQIRIARESGAPLHLGHFKVSSGAKPDGSSMAELIAIIEEAQKSGIRITADQYPWNASNTALTAMAIPRWAQDGGRDAMLRRFEDRAVLPRILSESADFFAARGGAQNILITKAPGQEALIGRRISELASEWNLTPAETAVRILKGGSPSVAIFAIMEADIRLLMKQPWTMFSSDGSATGHPRGHGSYPRLYTNYVLEGSVLTPKAFVHKASGLVADTLGLKGRGYIRPGAFADITVIDPANFRAHATFVEPTNLSTGVDQVIVNGELVLDGGKPTGKLPGRALLHTPPEGACS